MSIFLFRVPFYWEKCTPPQLPPHTLCYSSADAHTTKSTRRIRTSGFPGNVRLHPSGCLWWQHLLTFWICERVSGEVRSMCGTLLIVRIKSPYTCANICSNMFPGVIWPAAVLAKGADRSALVARELDYFVGLDQGQYDLYGLAMHCGLYWNWDTGVTLITWYLNPNWIMGI